MNQDIFRDWDDFTKSINIYTTNKTKTRFSINIDKFISDLGQDSLILPINIGMASINSTGKIIFPFFDLRSYTYSFFMFDITEKDDSIHIENKIEFTIDEFHREERLNDIYSLDEYFYLSTWRGIYRIDGNGNVNKIFNNNYFKGAPFNLEISSTYLHRTEFFSPRIMESIGCGSTIDTTMEIYILWGIPGMKCSMQKVCTVIVMIF